MRGPGFRFVQDSDHDRFGRERIWRRWHRSLGWWEYRIFGWRFQYVFRGLRRVWDGFGWGWRGWRGWRFRGFFRRFRRWLRA
jgi:hypothetical protein